MVISTGAHMIRTIKTLLKASPHILPLTDLNLWRPWMPPRPCLDPSSIPHKHFPSPYSYAGDASDDAPIYYPDAEVSVRVRPSGRYIHFHLYNKLLQYYSTAQPASQRALSMQGAGKCCTDRSGLLPGCMIQHNDAPRGHSCTL